MDQDLRRSEAWLGNHQCLVGVIRAVVAGPPPQAHRCGRGWEEHLARPGRGAGGRVVHQPPQGVDESCTYWGGGSASVESSVLWMWGGGGFVASCVVREVHTIVPYLRVEK